MSIGPITDSATLARESATTRISTTLCGAKARQQAARGGPEGRRFFRRRTEAHPGWPVRPAGLSRGREPARHGAALRAADGRARPRGRGTGSRWSPLMPLAPAKAGRRRSPRRSGNGATARRGGRCRDQGSAVEHGDLIGIHDARHPLGDDDDRRVAGDRAQGRAQAAPRCQDRARRRIRRRDRSPARVSGHGRWRGVGAGRPRDWFHPGRSAPRERRSSPLQTLLAWAISSALPHLLLRGLGVAIAKVAGHRAGEQHRPLCGTRPMRLQSRSGSSSAHIDAVDQHGPVT